MKRNQSGGYSGSSKPSLGPPTRGHRRALLHRVIPARKGRGQNCSALAFGQGQIPKGPCRSPCQATETGQQFVEVICWANVEFGYHSPSRLPLGAARGTIVSVAPLWPTTAEIHRWRAHAPDFGASVLGLTCQGASITIKLSFETPRIISVVLQWQDLVSTRFIVNGKLVKSVWALSSVSLSLLFVAQHNSLRDVLDSGPDLEGSKYQEWLVIIIIIIV